MRRYRFFAVLAALIVCAGLAVTPAPQANAAGLPMTKTASGTRTLVGTRVAGDFPATISYDDGTYSGTLTRQNATLSVTTRSTAPVSYTWKSATPYPIDNGKGPEQATSPSTYSYTYNDTAAGQSIVVTLPRTKANYFSGNTITATITDYHDGTEYKRDHSTLGYMSNNTTTYMGSYRFDQTPRQPQDYYGPPGESGLGWTQVGRRWAGELQDATKEPWRSLCIAWYGVALFDAETNGSNNRYRKPVWIDYERTAYSKYVYADYSGNVALKQTTITYTGTVTRRNSAPTVTMTNSPVEPNEGGTTTLTITGTDPDDDVLDTVVTWQPMGTNNATPGTVTTLTNYPRSSGSTFTLTRSSLADGYYKAVVTVTDPGGLKATKTLTVHVNGGPNITISTSPVEPNAGGSVVISVTPTDPDDSSVFLYTTIQPMGTNNATPGTETLIINSNRTTGTAHTVTRTNLAMGYYKVTATATDAGGLEKTVTKTFHVNGGPSVSISTTPAEPNAGSSVTVSVTPGDPDDSTVHLYATWQPMGTNNATPGTITPIFDSNRATGTAHSVTRSNLATGYYKIVATVIDAGGLTATTTKTIHVNSGPAVTISNTPVEPNKGGSTVVSVTPTDPDDANVQLYVTWQPMGVDNATPGTATPIINSQRATGTAHTVTRSSLAAGYYKVVATATDAGGMTATATRTIHVNDGPGISISNTPVEPNMGGSTTVTVAPTDPDDTVVDMLVTWQPMGTNNATPGTVTTIYNTTKLTSSAFTFTRSALAAGYYKVVATATDAGGLAATATKTIHVNGPPTVTITAPSIIAAGATAIFSSAVDDTDDSSVTLKVTWQPMGTNNATPGTVSTLHNASCEVGSGVLFTRSSLAVGYYKITATATDAGGLSATATKTIRVSSGPSVTLEHIPDVPNAGSSVNVTASLSDPLGGNLTTVITWQPMGANNNTPGTVTTVFSGSRASGTDYTFSRASLAAGYYKVVATVTNSLGSSDSATDTIFVNAPPSVSITSAPAPVMSDTGVVTVSVTPSDPNGGTLGLEVMWEYMGEDGETPGDGTIIFDGSRTAGSTYQFQKTGLDAGYYRVTAVVTDPGGMTDTAIHTVTVLESNRPPVVSLSADKAAYIEGDTAIIRALITDPDGNTCNVVMKVQDMGELGLSPGTETTAFSGPVNNGATVTYTHPGMIPHPLRITVTATDPGGLSDTETITVTTGPRGIEGQVLHTEQWELNRLDYNEWAESHGHPELVRPPELFFRGERFVLQALTSQHMQSNYVTVTIAEHPEFSTELTTEDGYNWTGWIWDAEMFNWEAQELTFIFENQYADGTITQDAVTVWIDEEEYFQLRMLY